MRLASGMLLGQCPEVQLTPPSSDKVRAAPSLGNFKRGENEKVPYPGADLQLRAEPRVAQSRSEHYLLDFEGRRRRRRRKGAPPHSK